MLPSLYQDDILTPALDFFDKKILKCSIIKKLFAFKNSVQKKCIGETLFQIAGQIFDICNKSKITFYISIFVK